MNQELKQRLIGAVVVTALAAIFIPMLFDDPVDNNGQSVSELFIPATPVKTGEESANKIPTSANQVLNTPDAGSETVVNTEEESELSANNEPPQEAPLDDEPIVDNDEGDDPTADGSINDRPAKSLDTGVVEATKKPLTTQKSLPVTESASEKSAPKSPLALDTLAEAPKKAQKKPETGVTKPVEKVKPITTATVGNAEKPAVKTEKSKSDLSRWYIQAGSFSKKENATSLMETLRKQGLPVTVETTKGAGNVPLYRLKVGPALEKKRAAEMKAKLDSQKIPSIMIAE